MMCLTKESLPQSDSSNLCGYEFVKQEILYSLSLLYTFLYNQYVMESVMNSLLQISLYLLF